MIEPQCLINVTFEEIFWRVLGDFLGLQIALKMTSKGQIAEQNTNEYVL